MEALEAIPEGVWNSLGGMYAGNCSFPSEIESCAAVHGVQPGSRTSYWSSFNLSVTRGSASFSSENAVLYSSSYESYYLDDFSPVAARRDSSVPMDYCLNQYRREGTTLQETRFQLDHLEYSQVNGADFLPSGDRILSSGVPGKRSRSSKDLHKITRTGRSKAAHKLDFATNNKEEANVIPSLSPCNSEDDSNEGVMTCSNLSPKGSTLCNVYLRPPSPNSKTRGSQGSASDPQSLYARKRREKINERLRILQNLVPNGTKVDISTMLEEAVHYVKFLQLQLLSSDELWMYAPVAYNGMDIGLDKAARRRQL